jgi:hypothetical protein
MLAQARKDWMTAPDVKKSIEDNVTTIHNFWQSKIYQSSESQHLKPIL